MTLVKHDSGSFFDPRDPGESCYSVNEPRLSVTENECRILEWLTAGRYVLEIGTGLGVSTRAMKNALVLVTVDPDPWVQANVWPELKREHLECCATLDAAKAYERFDVCFIDGNHRTDAVAADIKSAVGMLREDGLIVLHDVRYENVRLAAIQSGPLTTIQTEHGLGLLWARDVWR